MFLVEASTSVTTPTPPTQLNIELRITNVEWTDNLAIAGSTEYKDLVFEFENLVRNLRKL